MWFLIYFAVLAAIIYFYIIKPMSYWKDKNVVHEKPVPIFGNLLPVVLRKYSNNDLFQSVYRKFPNERYVGMYTFSKPSLLLRDPNLIKIIFVKEFDTFPEHVPVVPTDVDPLWSKNLFAMQGGKEWHELRSTLSPSFTSSKMKMMFLLIKECTQQFSNYFLKQGDLIDVELKDAFGRFATDVIATTAFGITCDSLSDPKNDFFIMGKDVSNFNGIKGLLFFLNFLSPSLARFFRIPMINEKVRNFFTTIVKDTLKLRKEKGITRIDMLHLLIEAQKGSLTYEEANVPETGFATVEEFEIGKVHRQRKIEVTDEIITAQVLLFFFAGFHTISTLLSFVCYELAINAEIQDRLWDEINDTLSKTNGELTYENLMSMKYLDMVISETLRKWPPSVFTERISVKPFILQPEKPNESSVFLDKGVFVTVPIGAIHKDPNYYPDPEKFDPERFSEENKHNIQPYTYLPFGGGPRNCIGSRFALLEAKLVVFEVINKFEIIPTGKTQIPLILSTSAIGPLPDDGITGKPSFSFNFPPFKFFSGFVSARENRFSNIKEYSGRRILNDSTLMVYCHDQTVAVVELGPKKLLLNCELVEIYEPDEAVNALGQMKKLMMPVYISLMEMLKLMAQCQQLETSKRFALMTPSQPSTIVHRGFLSNNPLTLLRGIIPGTKWCGTGDIAINYFDLGAEPYVDRCCRAHDLCPVKVRAYSQRYNLTNNSLYTKSYCICDDDLFECLKESNSPTAHIMGNIYFNLIQVPCIEDRKDVRINEATVHVATALGAGNVEYLLWKGIGKVNCNYGSTAPTVLGLHKRYCVGTRLLMYLFALTYYNFWCY
ncbi:hypothetical protein FQA39_LY03231 [Lamprigera yunnana]|nr:hypothetical protein FQA39_LY03231 [Lamprigera yunnana]